MKLLQLSAQLVADLLIERVTQQYHRIQRPLCVLVGELACFVVRPIVSDRVQLIQPRALIVIQFVLKDIPPIVLVIDDSPTQLHVHCLGEYLKVAFARQSASLIGREHFEHAAFPPIRSIIFTERLPDEVCERRKHIIVERSTDQLIIPL